MSRRFGRNQRRKLREEIARLEAIVYRGASPAPLDAIELEKIGVLRSSVTIDQDWYRHERHARVTVRGHDAEKLYLISDQRRDVSLEGVSYRTVSMQMRRPDDPDYSAWPRRRIDQVYETEVEIELRGVRR